MKFFRVLNIFIALALVFAMIPGASVQAQTATPNGEITRDTRFIPGQMVVAFEEGLSTKSYTAKAKALAGSVGAMVADSYSNVALLELDPQANVEALADEFVRAGLALAAQPNYVYWTPEEDSAILGEPLVTDGYSIASTNGDSLDLTWEETADLTRLVKKSGKYRSTSTFPKELLSGRLWGWDAVEADLIWSNSSSRVPIVAVLDTGVDYKHPDLRGKVTNGYDFFNDDKLSTDDNGHGTHVAGIIVAKQNYDYKTDESTAGVSNGKVLAVKVLGAQGYGTSYSLAAGIIYAAKNKSVKVINLSLTSPSGGEVEYSALQYAINVKGKLVVAAAGNDSTSELMYPAAWSHVYVTDPSESTNNISHGLVSVAAARAPSASDLTLWVNKNGDVNIDEDEVFKPEQCATGGLTEAGIVYGSNFGYWVSVVAPGEAIYSTTPVNNPFYLNYYNDVAPGYDYLSGSSMSAAFVAGAAARLLGKSILTADELMNPNQSVKDRLLSEGKPLDFAVENSGDPEFDPAAGYDNVAYGVTDGNGEPIQYGVPFPSMENGADDTIMAPFCWPDDSGDFGAVQAMDDTEPGLYNRDEAVYLNVADAMDRGALWTEIKDASNGQPLNKAIVAAYDISTVPGKSYRKGYVRTVAEGSNVVMINLPVASDGSTTYALKVSKSGYTSSYQTFNTVELTDGTNDGTIVMDNYSSVSIPAKTNINVVLDWMNGYKAGTEYGEPNLDLYIQIPGTEPNRGIIGPDSGLLESYDPDGPETTYGPNGPDWIDQFLGVGTILDPSKFTPDGIFTGFAPFAQHFFDGGVDTGVDGEGSLMSPNEYASIKYGAKVKGSPYYTPKYDGIYKVFVTDYSANDPSGNRFLTNDPDDSQIQDIFVAPIVRVWSYGNLIQTVKIEVGSSGCDGSYDWWHVVDINGANVPSSVNSCSDQSTVGY